MARKDWEYVPVKKGLCEFLDDYLTTDEAYRLGFKHKGDLVEELIRRWQFKANSSKGPISFKLFDSSKKSKT